MRASLAIVAVVLVALAWAPGFSAPYQYDDTVTPQSDPASQSLAQWAHSLGRTLRPLTKLTYAAESSAGLADAPERRGLNVILFMVTAGLLAGLCRQVGLGYPHALAIATLWAVHPVHAETLIALAGRSVLLSLMLMLASASCLLRERARLALGFALGAVLARETSLAWFVVCSGCVAWGRYGKRGLWTALFAGSVFGAALVFLSPRMRALMVFSFADPQLGNRLGLQWAALPQELLLWLFQPDAFTVDMEFAPRGLLRALYLLGALALYAGVGFLAVRGRERSQRVAAALLLCLVVPLHSVVPKLDALTARCVSASSAPLLLLLAPGLRAAWSGGALARRLVWCGWAALILAWVPLSRRHAALYQDPIALWRDVVSRTHEATRPLINLGTLLAQKGQLEEAHVRLREAVRRNPHSSDARERLEAVETMLETRRLMTDSPARGNNSGP